MTVWFLVIAAAAALPTVASFLGVVRAGHRHPGGRMGWFLDGLLASAGNLVALIALVTAILTREFIAPSTAFWIMLGGFVVLAVVSFLPPVRAARARLAACNLHHPMQYGDEVR